MQENKAKLLGLVVIGLLALGGTGAVIVLNKQENTQPTEGATAPEQSTAVEADSSESTTQSSNNYRDGEYSADGSYRTPGGNETITVTLSLKDNAVTAVSVDGNGTGESAEYQAMFKQGISKEVIGKKIDQINVSRVSGSSLTSTGFNNAIDTIEREASA
jgi:uncharacterized protein with FMN-binding domain